MSTEQELKQSNSSQKEFKNLLDQDFKDRKLTENQIIKGTVTADTITVEGEVDGDIQAKDIYIKSTAKIKGNIRYQNIDIQNGSIINADLFYSS